MMQYVKASLKPVFVRFVCKRCTYGPQNQGAAVRMNDFDIANGDTLESRGEFCYRANDEGAGINAGEGRDMNGGMVDVWDLFEREEK